MNEWMIMTDSSYFVYWKQKGVGKKKLFIHHCIKCFLSSHYYYDYYDDDDAASDDDNDDYTAT